MLPSFLSASLVAFGTNTKVETLHFGFLFWAETLVFQFSTGLVDLRSLELPCH